MHMLNISEEEEHHVIRYLRTSEQGLRVVFRKKDGTERTMHCTLNQKRIPAEKQPTTLSQSLEEKTDSTAVPNAIRVFDLEKMEWRSFRWDSLISIDHWV